MITLLLDHHLTGYRQHLRSALEATGWLDLIELRLVTLAEVNLPEDSPDPVVWRLAQAQRLLLVTDNRNRKGTDSLEQTLREEGTPDSLPVITIGNRARLKERAYCELCAERLIEVVVDLENTLGCGRLFIP